MKKQQPDLRARPDLTWEQRETGRILRQKFSTIKDSVEYFIDYNKKCIVKKSDTAIFLVCSNLNSALDLYGPQL